MFLIDTNILSEVIRPRPNLAVVRTLLSAEPARRFASERTRYELRFGAMLRDDSSALWTLIEKNILPLAHWLPVDAAVVLAAADLAAMLRRTGQPIDGSDLMLAATAKVHGLTVVTRKLRHFERVPGLQVENWFPGEPGSDI
ncbi:MAG: PIN domain-containing protein [Burkholderiaceae bacterium]|nr:PIN domain-containing protein [Burkholderiaceae bacterium]